MEQHSIFLGRTGAGTPVGSAENDDTDGDFVGERSDDGEPKRRSRDSSGTVREPPPLRFGQPLQHLRQHLDADRAALHAPGLRPGADVALGGDPGHAHRHRGLPLPDDGHSGSRARPGARPRRRQAPGQARFTCPAGDPDPRDRACRAGAAGHRRARSGGDPALPLRLRPLRVLRRAVDAGLPLRALHVPLDAGRAGRVLGCPAASPRPAQPGADGEAPAGGRRCAQPLRTLRRGDAGR